MRVAGLECRPCGVQLANRDPNCSFPGDGDPELITLARQVGDDRVQRCRNAVGDRLGDRCRRFDRDKLLSGRPLRRFQRRAQVLRDRGPGRRICDQDVSSGSDVAFISRLAFLRSPNSFSRMRGSTPSTLLELDDKANRYRRPSSDVK